MRARLWISAVVALIWAVSVVGSSAANYTMFDYWDATNGTASSTIFTGISGDLAVGNYSYGNSNGFVYSVQNGSYSALDLYTTTNSVQVSGISGNSVVGTYRDGSDISHGFVRNLSNNTVLTLGANTQAYGLSGNYIVGRNNDTGQYFIYDTSKQSDQITILLNIATSDYYVTGISGNTIVGYYDDVNATGNTYGFFYTFVDGSATDPLTSYAIAGNAVTKIYGIDDQGTIIGSYSADGNTSTSFVKSETSEAENVLPPEDATSTDLYAVDGTTAVGQAIHGANQTSGVIAQAVPEPTTYVLIALGMLVMAVSRCKARFSRQS